MNWTARVFVRIEIKIKRRESTLYTNLHRCFLTLGIDYFDTSEAVVAWISNVDLTPPKERDKNKKGRKTY